MVRSFNANLVLLHVLEVRLLLETPHVRYCQSWRSVVLVVLVVSSPPHARTQGSGSGSRLHNTRSETSHNVLACRLLIRIIAKTFNLMFHHGYLVEVLEKACCCHHSGCQLSWVREGRVSALGIWQSGSDCCNLMAKGGAMTYQPPERDIELR
jgi:hypothetical protein